jgi:hypothetical protein
MQKLLRIVFLPIFAAIILTPLLRAADPINGTWKLDVRSSKFLERPPKEQIEKYSELASGDMELVLTRTQTDGVSTTIRLTWPAKGGVVIDPAGALPKGETITEVLLGPGDWLAIFLIDGKQQIAMHKVISMDGKTMTQTFKTVDPQGRPFEQVQVLHRQ